MRKAAGLKRGSRKKQQQNDDTKPPSPAEAPPLAPSTNERRKPSGEEAALTSKNYRLAKELSELRVRHRDETKNVTRLTMENMNLASRCREAISHVAMLKKELEMHRRRTNDALVMQRLQSQRTSSSVSDSNGVLSDLSELARSTGNHAPLSTDVAVEMDRMDRILAAHTPPPPPPEKDIEDPTGKTPRRSPTISIGESVDSSPESQKSSTSEAEETQNDANIIEDDSKETSSELAGTIFRSKSLFPQTASPKPKTRESYMDEYPGDVTPHKASHESSLPSVVDEEQEQGDSVPLSDARELANKKLSSIDAFEASFDTAFPMAFTSPKDGPGERTSEIYNPFFSSPAKTNAATATANSPANRNPEQGDGGSLEKGRKWGSSVRKTPTTSGKSPSGIVPNSVTPTRSQASGRIIDLDRSPASVDPASPLRDGEPSDSRLLNPSSSPKIVSNASRAPYNTPPHFFQQSTNEPEPGVEQPRRPEKTASASARARYEKALQPRTYTSRIKEPSPDRSDLGTTVDTSLEATKDVSTSPSTVLRRLQQRRAKSDRFQPPVDASLGGETRRPSNRSIRHPSAPSDESPFDEAGGPGSQNGVSSFRSSEKDAQNNGHQWSRTNPAAKKLSPDSMHAEIRALDAMASGSYHGDLPSGPDSPNTPDSSSSAQRFNVIKQRRSVKQPVSYAEPPINAKMRRGDTYFAKGESDDDPTTPVVSPGGSSDDSQRGSRTRSGVSPEEVLKDLAGPTTVRS